MHNSQSMSRVERIADLVSRETFHSNRLSPLQRFRLICRGHGILINNDHSRSSFISNIGSSTMITLASDLTKPHREFIAFHELGHYFLDHFGGKTPSAISELEANLFAFLALKPKEVQK